MIINSGSINFEDLTNNTIAKKVFNVFLYQYVESTKNTIIAEAELNSKIAANESYTKDMDGPGFGGGFGQSPFSDYSILCAKEKLIKNKKEEKEAKAVMIFLRDIMMKDFDLK